MKSSTSRSASPQLPAPPPYPGPFYLDGCSTQLTGPPGASLSLLSTVARVHHDNHATLLCRTLLEGSHHPRYRLEVLHLSLACSPLCLTPVHPYSTMQRNCPPTPKLL